MAIKGIVGAGGKLYLRTESGLHTLKNNGKEPGGGLTITLSETIATPFMALFGIPSMTVSATATIPTAGVYVTNRELSDIGNSSSSKWAPITHTFTFMVNENGSITTFSWGNSANLHGWSMDQPEDLAASSQALMNGDATEVAPFVMEPFFQQAYDQLNIPANNHSNWIVTDNCKTETIKLKNLAFKLAGFNP
jgi:hypothetical protein